MLIYSKLHIYEYIQSPTNIVCNYFICFLWIKDDPSVCTEFDASKNILSAFLCSISLEGRNKYICLVKLGHR